MSKQLTVKINPSLRKKMEDIYSVGTDTKRRILINVADQATQLSPVDTGAYVTSHSFKTNRSSRGRSKSSKGKPRKQNVQGKRDEGFNNLMEDLQKIDLEGFEKIVLRNDSPHANQVEYKNGYYVYAKLRQRFK